MTAAMYEPGMFDQSCNQQPVCHAHLPVDDVYLYIWLDGTYIVLISISRYMVMIFDSGGTVGDLSRLTGK